MRDLERDKEFLIFIGQQYSLSKTLPKIYRIATYWIEQYELLESELAKYHKLHDDAYNEIRILTEDYEKSKSSVFKWGTHCDQLTNELNQLRSANVRICTLSNNLEGRIEQLQFANAIMHECLYELRKMEFDQYGNSTYVSEHIDYHLERLGGRTNA